VAKQRQLFRIRQAAETPTRDFPAPQGSTIMPDLALPAIHNKFENKMKSKLLVKMKL